MRNFWSYVSNDKYAIGCTGQTVHVYDCAGIEIAKFSDIKYAYTAMFCPQSNLFVIRSTTVWFAFYSLDTLQLIKKMRMRIPNSQPQDEGFCFSPDGKHFMNIEYQDNLTTDLVIYNMEDFREESRIFASDPVVLSHIERSDSSFYYLIGFRRGQDGIIDYPFIAKFDGVKIVDLKEIDEQNYDYIHWYKSLELSGFTRKSIEWSPLKDKKLTPVKLADIYGSL